MPQEYIVECEVTQFQTYKVWAVTEEEALNRVHDNRGYCERLEDYKKEEVLLAQLKQPVC